MVCKHYIATTAIICPMPQPSVHFQKSHCPRMNDVFAPLDRSFSVVRLQQTSDMKEYTISKDINAIGTPVKTFPLGIDQAFQDLVKKIPGGFSRPYYGIGDCIDGKMTYIAAAMEKTEGEGKQLGLETYKIEKGNYLAEEITDWRDKTACIKDVFEKMYKDDRADRSAPSIEIYENDHVMKCLVKLVN